MKFEPPLSRGKLVRRYKRFLADIELPDGELITIHCPNTGAMTQCAVPGSEVWFATSGNPKRKYAHTWELAVVDGEQIGINSARANSLVREAIENGVIPELAGYALIRPEVRIGTSRFDFVLREHVTDLRPCTVEVKSVTLLHDADAGKGSFPDAVSVRATKHLRHLADLARAGERAVLFFCAQHTGIRSVAPARSIDPQYADSLHEAINAGVEVLAYGTRIGPLGCQVSGRLPVREADA